MPRYVVKSLADLGFGLRREERYPGGMLRFALFIVTHRTLVVEVNPDIVESVQGILGSLGHGGDTANSQNEARRFLAKSRHDYCLLDLEIPVHPDRRVARIQSGERLLRETVARRGERWEPIAMTGHGLYEPSLAVEVMNLGPTTLSRSRSPSPAERWAGQPRMP